jgi:hypothetical protein
MTRCSLTWCLLHSDTKAQLKTGHWENKVSLHYMIGGEPARNSRAIVIDGRTLVRLYGHSASQLGILYAMHQANEREE